MVAMPRTLTTPATGEQFAGRYRVDGLLGKGGMAVVIAATEEATGEPLAIKLLGSEDEPEATEDTAERAARLMREARAAMRIASEHVVRVRDVATDAEFGPYIVMERLRGSDLSQAWPLETQMPVTDAADVALQVCEALSHAHAAGIVHRDIKLSNLFRADGPDGSAIKVLDFGISKLTTRAEWERTERTLTVADAVLGSPQFVSPEQLRDSSAVDGRTDIWALGVVIYRLMTGAYPFAGATIGQLFTRILERDPEPLAERGVESAAMQSIVTRCLERDLARRYQDVGELARDLAPLASERWAPLATSIEARLRSRRSIAPPALPTPAATAAPRRRRRSRSKLAGLSVAVLLGAGLFAIARARGPRELPSSPTAAAASAVPPAPLPAPIVSDGQQEVHPERMAPAPTAPPTELPVPRPAASPTSKRDAPFTPPVATDPPKTTPTPSTAELHANPYARRDGG